jgi:hypothetical protein
MTQQGRNMWECVTIDDKTLFVHLLVISVFVRVILSESALPQIPLFQRCAMDWTYRHKQMAQNVPYGSAVNMTNSGNLF